MAVIFLVPVLIDGIGSPCFIDVANHQVLDKDGNKIETTEDVFSYLIKPEPEMPKKLSQVEETKAKCQKRSF